MTRPRQVPEQFILINRRCTQRQYRLRPDDETNNNVLYCLGRAMQTYQMEVLMLSVRIRCTSPVFRSSRRDVSLSA
ncbi:MAG: hypothetical protein H0T46_05040 [Deltaproteobacteria bacterium]|nr:hypothetical protein [Deltaproteobacteria bacterium]